MTGYRVEDKVRVIQVPLYLYTDNPVDKETAEFIERCLGKVFRVESLDEYGQLELWATEKGNRKKVLGGYMHWIWMEPEYVEPFPQPSSAA